VFENCLKNKDNSENSISEMQESRYFSGFSTCEKFIQKKHNLLLTHQNTGDIIAFADAPKGNKK
jgi:hypothetical protein